MSHITLTAEQAQIINQSGKPVEVRDPEGKWVGCIDPIEAAIVAEVVDKRRNGPQECVSIEKVQEHRRALEAEWNRLGGFDREFLHRFLAKLRAEDKR